MLVNFIAKQTAFKQIVLSSTSRFNPTAAERHLKFCTEQAKRKPANNQAKSAAAQRREKMKGVSIEY